MKDKYKVITDDDNYLLGFEIIHNEKEEEIYEFDASEMNIEYINCYKIVNGKLIFDNEKYQKMLAKKEFIEIETLDTEVINGYRIIKDSNYNFLITSDVLLWIIIGLTLIVKIAKILRSKTKQR